MSFELHVWFSQGSGCGSRFLSRFQLCSLSALYPQQVTYLSAPQLAAGLRNVRNHSTCLWEWLLRFHERKMRVRLSTVREKRSNNITCLSDCFYFPTYIIIRFIFLQVFKIWFPNYKDNKRVVKLWKIKVKKITHIFITLTIIYYFGIFSYDTPSLPYNNLSIGRLLKP